MITQKGTLGFGHIMVFNHNDAVVVEHKLVGYKGEVVKLNRAKIDKMREAMNTHFDKLWEGNVDGIVTLAALE